MPLITLIVTIALAGLLLWAINTYLPMDGKIKKILNVVVVIVVILWILSVFGLLAPLSSMRIG
ncbi:Thivi_2564 family membrane protein [Thiorhodospira sibirica]|uniref:Thivi_2564 family membrane protein n=1 Tax=Thiorhodospira sibirica TaxID=154347 RepID=UPI00022C2876|nr:Thivi_2564 family membrane protein [Thiorhodospira sibirica]